MTRMLLNGTFVPADLDCSDFANLEPLYQALLDRPLASAGDARQWLDDLSDLSAVVSEYGSRRNIELACDTENKDKEAAYMNFIENVSPKIQPIFSRLQRKLLDTPFADELAQNEERFAVMVREWKTDVSIFRDENVPLFTQATKLYTEYSKVRGAMMVEFDGKEYTLQQMGRFLEEPDRAVREKAWKLSQARQAKDWQTCDDIFQKMIDIRSTIAKNADEPDFRAYQWKAFGRFDYTPEDCLQFADTIEQTFMPLVRQLDEARRAELGVDTLRPWDTAVDVKSRPPLRPFDDSAIDSFIDGTKRILAKVAPSLAEDFETLRTNGNLDLASRKGKRPGGFQATLQAVRQPFIFMNAAGLQRDVDTLLHEGGHAFHTMWCDEPLTFLRHAPMEFCEVASMSMELLGCDYYGVFYDTADEAARAKRQQLEGIIRFFPWMATIDGFQHWLYTHPGHTPQQRAEAWLAILDRFSSGVVDWSGFEDERRYHWQKQLHLYGYPFYYVEYGIAQIGALQVWRNGRQDANDALAKYRAALKLGGTRPLPELFETCGIEFDFTSRTIAPLVELLGAELAKLPA